MVTPGTTPNRPAHTIWGFDSEFLPTGKAGDPGSVHSVACMQRLYLEARETKKKLILDTDHFYMDDYPATIDTVSTKIRIFFERRFSHVL